MKTILIVDDDTALCAVLEEFLQRQGYLCLIANDAYAGITRAVKEKPDLVLVDINMPVGGGIALIENLQRNPIAKSTPIICMTSLDLKVAVPKLPPTAPIRAIFRKPVVLMQLRDKIAEILPK